MIFKTNIISQRLIDQYKMDAISAAADTGVNISYAADFVQQIDKLCVMLHDDLEYIQSQDILLDSIAIKNTALVYGYLKLTYPSETVVWYRNDQRFGKNTYPVLFGSIMIFPKIWIKNAIISGKKGDFIKAFKEAVTSN